MLRARQRDAKQTPQNLLIQNMHSPYSEPTVFLWNRMPHLVFIEQDGE
jgi:hypothetical protein